jgi:hypothetical protein
MYNLAEIPLKQLANFVKTGVKSLDEVPIARRHAVVREMEKLAEPVAVVEPKPVEREIHASNFDKMLKKELIEFVEANELDINIRQTKAQILRDLKKHYGG